jgi:hypothetical protein
MKKQSRETKTNVNAFKRAVAIIIPPNSLIQTLSASFNDF